MNDEVEEESDGSTISNFESDEEGTGLFEDDEHGTDDDEWAKLDKMKSDDIIAPTIEEIVSSAEFIISATKQPMTKPTYASVLAGGVAKDTGFIRLDAKVATDAKRELELDLSDILTHIMNSMAFENTKPRELGSQNMRPVKFFKAKSIYPFTKGTDWELALAEGEEVVVATWADEEDEDLGDSGDKIKGQPPACDQDMEISSKSQLNARSATIAPNITFSKLDDGKDMDLNSTAGHSETGLVDVSTKQETPDPSLKIDDFGSMTTPMSSNSSLVSDLIKDRVASIDDLTEVEPLLEKRIRSMQSLSELKEKDKPNNILSPLRTQMAKSLSLPRIVENDVDDRGSSSLKYGTHSLKTKSSSFPAASALPPKLHKLDSKDSDIYHSEIPLSMANKDILFHSKIDWDISPRPPAEELRDHLIQYLDYMKEYGQGWVAGCKVKYKWKVEKTKTSAGDVRVRVKVLVREVGLIPSTYIMGLNQ